MAGVIAAESERDSFPQVKVARVMSYESKSRDYRNGVFTATEFQRIFPQQPRRSNKSATVSLPLENKFTDLFEDLV